VPTSSSFRHLLIALALLALPVEGQEFVRKVGGYEVLVKAGEQNGVLEISPITPGSLKAFTVPSPRRLVIDLPMREAVQNEAIEIAPDGFIHRLRVGTHPDRMRIVVDVGSEVLRYAQRIEGKTSILALRSGDTRPTKDDRASENVTGNSDTINNDVGNSEKEKNSASDPIPPKDETSALSKEAVEPRRGVSLTDGTLGGPKSPAPPPAHHHPLPSSREAEKRVAPSEKEEEPPRKNFPQKNLDRGDDGSARLSAIEFHPESLEIKLKFTARAPFGLVRRSSREYVVTMPGGGITSNALTLDHFPPRELVGFTFVRAVQLGEALHIEIGVDPNTKITAVPERSGIVLRATPKGIHPSRD